MIVYLTSSFIPLHEEGASAKSAPWDCHGFFEDLKKEWPERARLLYVPCGAENNFDDDQMERMLDALTFNGLSIEEVRIQGENTSYSARENVLWSNVIYLAGGHAPTQLAFMNRIGLKKALLNYKGIVIGLSAGSVNAASYVYLMPELEGEAIDPNFVRLSYGLGLTNLQIIPHRESMKNKIIDNMHFIEDVVIPDSFGRRFYLINDGSYFKVKSGKTVFKGEGEIIEDGTIRPLKQGTIVPYMGHIEQPVIKSLLEDGYDMLIAINKETEKSEVYYLSERLSAVFETGKMNYPDICFRISQRIVEEERECFLDQLMLSVIMSEIIDRGNFVRTVHIDIDGMRHAKSIRALEVPGLPEWVVLVFFDITTALDHDWMTDEYSRTGFLNRARLFISEIKEDDHYSLVYTNVKGFKVVNELFGDQNGDLMIFQTRDILRQYLSPVILGRLESDHYVLITDDKNLTPANLKRMSHQVFKSSFREYNYEIRCGIYKIGSSHAEVTHLLAGAKLAEKSIKEGKKNSLFAYYDVAMKENYIKQRYLLSDCERALADKEFEPYYQPIVDAMTGEIVSAEMLIRWRHRDLGMVSPADFVPVIESDGKISVLDNFMIESGMKHISRLKHKNRRTVPCAINLSRISFYDTEFIESIFTRIKDLNIDTSMLRFEVTESAYADLETQATDYLRKMKEQGIKILLDDYGSGMSSLSMLETFDFDIIKLDIGFIRRIGVSDKVESIIASTINLAHLIGAKVTAEGVETEKQLSFLRSVDCDYIQGYYFYKPLSEEEFERVLEMQ